jgi:DNA-binding NarL/FixJ family response regulator
MRKEKIKLILADDHVLIREGFKALLGKNEDFEVIGEASDGKDLLRLISKERPDVLLVDITMPGMSGLEALEEIRKEDAYLKIIILTMHEEREYVLKAIRKGANGFLLKNVEKQELETAIKSVHEGGKYFSPFVINILAESVSKPEKEEPAEISAREKEVLELVAKGFSTKHIADQLGISFRTVESHRINMLKKLKVSNSAELIRKAVELKII